MNEQLTRRAVCLLYRSLLRRSRVFDKFPISKVYLKRYPNSCYREVRTAFREAVSQSPLEALSTGFSQYKRLGQALDQVSKEVPWYNSSCLQTSSTRDPYVVPLQKVEKGSVLLVHPVADPYKRVCALFSFLLFQRTVTLILQTEKGEAFGVFLNRPTKDRLQVQKKVADSTGAKKVDTPSFIQVPTALPLARSETDFIESCMYAQPLASLPSTSRGRKRVLFGQRASSWRLL
jgi:hypothetical protein